jgi:hypothetical protein
MAIDPALLALLEADPGYQQILGDVQGASAAEKGQRNASMQRSMAEFGEIPDLSQSLSALGLTSSDMAGITTPEAQTLAQSLTNSGVSTKAQLEYAQKKAIQGISNALASRNMLRSGDTGYNVGQQNLAYTQNQYNARKTLLDYLAGIQSGYAAAERQRQSDLRSAWTDAYGRALEKWNTQQAAATTTGTTTGGTTTGNTPLPDPTGGAGTTTPFVTPTSTTIPGVGTVPGIVGGGSPVNPVPTPPQAPVYIAPPGDSGGGRGPGNAPTVYTPPAPVAVAPPPAPVAPYSGYNPYQIPPGTVIYR